MIQMEKEFFGQKETLNLKKINQAQLDAILATINNGGGNNN